MKRQWISTTTKGVRYYEHETRLLTSGRADKYFSIRIKHAGKLHEYGVGWASEGWTVAKAQALLSKLKEAHKTGEGPRTLAELAQQNNARRDAERLTDGMSTLSEFFDKYYLPAAQKRKRTWSHDKGRFDKEIRPVLGDCPLRGVTAVHIEELLASLRKSGISEATALQYMAILRQIFNLARTTFVAGVPMYQEQHSPMDGVRLPRALVERERFLTYEEADVLISAAHEHTDLHDLVVLALNTGLRFGEIIRLQWADIDLRHGVCSVRHEDMRKPGGRIPLNSVALDMLKMRHGHCEKGSVHIFPLSVTGKDGCILRRQYEELVKRCELNKHSTSVRDRVVFHTLRHTFASWLAMSGVDLYRIKALMRHKTIRMTERYAHLMPDATRQAVEHLRPISNSL